jgi:nucleoprotein TPR
MKTRRKSKQAAAAAAAASPELELERVGSVASLDGTAGPSRIEFTVSIPDDLDLEYLSRFLPDVSLETPSQDTVLSLYRLVVSQGVDLDAAVRDLEESRAENEKKDVELDQALQDRESSVSSLEVQVKALQEELASVTQERNVLGESESHSTQTHIHVIVNSSFICFCHSQASSKSNLESQISTLSSSQSMSSTELDSFKHKVEDIEREKRDLLGVVSRLKEDSAQRDGVFSMPFTYRVCRRNFK